MRTVTAGLALSAALLAPTAAHATPSSGVTATPLAQGAIPAALVSYLGDVTDFAVREVTIAPGGSSGWHYHEGRVIGLVRSGVLTHQRDNCAAQVLPAGSLVEVAPGIHDDRNLGSEPLILDVVYLNKPGKPANQDAPAPACEE
ncbi:cupin domain-containing protein [Antrihabitans sp. YC2-6]|uniref:cupin domain-containing protein n=1 Tax=Antrihabitans sp. YC2-6 TaxID=2799498 RepID=UPI0018F408B8|nr:cupin domain-containing protein [Antrihabitans sp. YC2-6]MBJ8348801.1 cupin domain-containing protein [Antrihabitans sp. YC2-6]